jgi:hypothetical protein
VSELLKISHCDDSQRVADVVFVHGLDGDAKSTWHPNDNPNAFWPEWVGEDCPNLGVWSLDYEASALGWKGHAMPLDERATEVLAVFDTDEIGKRPVVFVVHSLGGLLIKRVLKNAWESENPHWKQLVSATKGIVFLATPHSGANIANWVKYLGEKLLLLRINVVVEDLQAHDPELRRLNTWYRNKVAKGELRVRTEVYYEKQATKGLLVVDETSSNPGIAGVEPIPLDADHVSICKPASKESVLYRRIRRFIEDSVAESEGNFC